MERRWDGVVRELCGNPVIEFNYVMHSPQLTQLKALGNPLLQCFGQSASQCTWLSQCLNMRLDPIDPIWANKLWP